MLDALKGLLPQRRVRTRAQLRRFVSGEASYVAQRSTYEFSRNTLAWYGQAAFGDPAFNAAFAVCRWEAFAAIAADMVLVLRDFLSDATRLDAALLRLYGDVLNEYPHPEHRPAGWGDCQADLLARLNAAADGRPPDLTAMGRRTGALIHDKAPARSNNQEEERAVLAAAVTFGLISFQDRLPRRLDATALISDLAHRPT